MFTFSHNFPSVKTTYPRVNTTDPIGSHELRPKIPRLRPKIPVLKPQIPVKHYLNKMTWSYLYHFKVGRIIALICISLTLYGGGCVFIVLISQLLGSLVGNAGGISFGSTNFKSHSFYVCTFLQVYICTCASGWWWLLSS